MENSDVRDISKMNLTSMNEGELDTHSKMAAEIFPSALVDTNPEDVQFSLTSKELLDSERSFFESWEAIMIISVNALFIFCIILLWLLTRTRLRDTQWCKPLVEKFASGTDSGTTSEGDIEKRLIGNSFTVDERLDYFDHLSDSDSTRRPSSETTQSVSSQHLRDSPDGSLQCPSEKLLQSSESLENLADEIVQRSSDDCLKVYSKDNCERRAAENIINFSGESSIGQSIHSLECGSAENSKNSFVENLEIDSRDKNTNQPTSILRRSSETESLRRQIGENSKNNQNFTLRGSLTGSVKRNCELSYESEKQSKSDRLSRDNFRRQSRSSIGNGPVGILKSNRNSLNNQYGNSGDNGHATITKSSAINRRKETSLSLRIDLANNYSKSTIRSPLSKFSNIMGIFNGYKSSMSNDLNLSDNKFKTPDGESLNKGLIDGSIRPFNFKRRASLGSLRTPRNSESFVGTHHTADCTGVGRYSRRRSRPIVRFDSRERVALYGSAELMCCAHSSEDLKVKQNLNSPNT